MKVNDRKIQINRHKERVLEALQLIIPAALLTADDIWCVTNEQSQQLVKGSFEIIEGYGETKNGLERLHREFAERGFQIELRSGFTTPPFKTPERGRGVWLEIKSETQTSKRKLKNVCSRCGKGTAIKTNYCAYCGANMRSRDAEI